jgi:hypothetical protein
MKAIAFAVASVFRDRPQWRTRNTRMRRNTVNTVVTVTPA